MQPEPQQQRFFALGYPSSDSTTQTTSGCHDQASRGLLPLHFLFHVRERVWASRYLISYILLAALFLSFWHSRATHRFSVRAFPVFAALCGFSLIYGRFFIKLSSLSFKATSSFSLQFVCGYLVMNALLFLLGVFTPFGIAINVSLVTGGSLLILLFSPAIAKDVSKPVDYLPDFLCLLLSGIAATIWCTDGLRPFVREGPVTVYQTFTDSFFHARMISGFAQAHGLKTMSVIQMSGYPTPMYHYAMYLTPAAVSFFADSSAYITLVSFLIPFGVLLIGLAAFSLAGSVWGRWPGIAATVATTLLPDASQQGFGNKWLSYYMFQQISPNSLYGIACVAIAWMFILDGCRVPRLSSILFGYAVLIISIVYKAQFFLASAFLLMIYPCIFFRGLRIRWRIISAVALVSLFCLVVSLSQGVDRIPTLRLDGSALRPYTYALLKVARQGCFKSFYENVLLEKESWPIVSLYGTSILLVCTFGIWTAICFVNSFLLRAKIAAAALLFPLLVIVNYLVMSLGLAGDAKGVGQPEELLHRPFIWAYFVVAAWGGAGVYVLLFGSGPPASRFARIFAAIIAISSLSAPLVWAHNLQTFPSQAWSYRGLNSVPTGLVKACSYIRKHSQTEDVIQDSENDPKFWVTGLAERQEFAADCKVWKVIYNPPGLRERLNELADCKKVTDETTLTEFMQKHRISWYILQPASEVVWPTSVLAKPVFRAGDYRVFHFSP